MRYNIILSLILLFTIKSIAQVTLTLPPQNPFRTDLSNILNVHILNHGSRAGENHDLYLVARVFNKNELVAEFQTFPFILEQGNTSIRYDQIGLKYQNYYNEVFRESIEETNQFPEGDFSFCTSLIQGESEKVLDEKCLDIISIRPQPPKLIFPANGAEVKTSQPVFSWLPVRFPGKWQNGVLYKIIIREILGDQTKESAMFENFDLCTQDNLTVPFFPYPAEANQQLEKDHRYAWQVFAYKDENLIGSSEIWEFKFIRDEIRIDSLQNAGYVQLNRYPGTNYTTAVGKLKFIYSGEYVNAPLKFRIYNDSQKDIISGSNELYQKYGENKYEIDLSKVRGIKQHIFYTLEVVNEKNEKSTLRFQYIKPVKSGSR